MKILIVGGGGREHALAWKCAKDTNVEVVYVAPGNAGTRIEPKCKNINATTINDIVQFAKENLPDLTIIGPEALLCDGIADRFQEIGLPCFGPSQASSRLEGSKIFAKNFMRRHNIPTPISVDFETAEDGLEYLKNIKDHTEIICLPEPVVIKEDGLAAGKGVTISSDFDYIQESMKTAGKNNQRILLEQYIEGQEVSFIVMSDGKNVVPFASAQDHKRILDGDKGPNTGGMGAYSPSPIISTALFNEIMTTIVYPTINGMAQDKNPFVGFLYVGLMIDSTGKPTVLEYNVRMGDPEAQPLLMRLKSSLPNLCLAAIDGKLGEITPPIWNNRVALGVVIASDGYPDAYETGKQVYGLNSIDETKTKVFHSGTGFNKDNYIITTGGRVLCITSLGDTYKEARDTTYANVKKIHWAHKPYYRRDIGYQAIEAPEIR